MSTSFHQAESARITLSDASELDSLISVVETRNTQITPSPCDVILRRFSAGETAVEGNQVLFRVRGRGAPRPGCVALAVVHRCYDTRFNCNGITMGDLLFCGAGGDFDILANHDFEWFGLALRVSRFEEYVTNCLGIDPEQFACRTLTMRAGSLTSDLRRWWNNVFSTQEEVAPWNGEQIIDTFLGVFCSTIAPAHHEFTVPRKRRHTIALQAEEYLRANIAGRASISALCRDLGISRRTLETAFIEVFSLSPAAYFQNLKLTEARKLLKTRLPEWGGIKAIAYDCGFSKLSNFSSAYRRLFGELPSQTSSRLRDELRKNGKG